MGKEFAEYINENIKEKTTILCSFNTQYQPIVAYLPKDKYKFYLTGPQREATYVTWDKTWNEMANDEKLDSTIARYLEENDSVYIITDTSIEYRMKDKYNITKLLGSQDVKLIHSKYNFMEFFNLYEIKRIVS